MKKILPFFLFICATLAFRFKTIDTDYYLLDGYFYSELFQQGNEYPAREVRRLKTELFNDSIYNMDIYRNDKRYCGKILSDDIDIYRILQLESEMQRDKDNPENERKKNEIRNLKIKVFDSGSYNMNNYRFNEEYSNDKIEKKRKIAKILYLEDYINNNYMASNHQLKNKK